VPQWRRGNSSRTPRPFQHHLTAGRGAKSDRGQYGTDRAVIILVRRIQQDEIERDGGVHVFERVGQRPPNHRAAVRNPAALQVGLDQCDGAGVAINERHGGGAAAEGLQPERPGSGASVQDRGLGDRPAEDVEQRFPEAVRRRPQAGPGW